MERIACRLDCADGQCLKQQCGGINDRTIWHLPMCKGMMLSLRAL